MIKISSLNQHLIDTSIQDVYGGKEIHINLGFEAVDAIKWVQEHRRQLEKERKLRESNPALSNAWDQYQTMLRIVMDDV